MVAVEQHVARTLAAQEIEQRAAVRLALISRWT
jgi:hypothetical protein